MSGLPAGFVLDETKASSGLPSGFVLDEPKKPEKPPEEPGAFGRFGQGAARQFESLVSSGKTAYETVTGENPAEVAKRAEERQKKITESYAPERTLEDVTKAYKEKGLLSAAGEVLYQVPGAVGSLIPTLAGGAIGGLFGGPAGAIAAVAGPSFVTQLGSNLEAQFAEQARLGKPIDPNQGAAAIGAVAQAGLDTVGFMIPFGKAIISPIVKTAGKGGVAAAEKLAAESITKTLAKGTATGILAEVPTEVAQQMIERYQADKELFSDDAQKEYGEIAYKAAISVAPLGGPSRMLQRGAARRASEAPVITPDDLQEAIVTLKSDQEQKVEEFDKYSKESARVTGVNQEQLEAMDKARVYDIPDLSKAGREIEAEYETLKATYPDQAEFFEQKKLTALAALDASSKVAIADRGAANSIFADLAEISKEDNATAQAAEVSRLETEKKETAIDLKASIDAQEANIPSTDEKTETQKTLAAGKAAVTPTSSEAATLNRTKLIESVTQRFMASVPTGMEPSAAALQQEINDAGKSSGLGVSIDEANELIKAYSPTPIGKKGKPRQSSELGLDIEEVAANIGGNASPKSGLSVSPTYSTPVAEATAIVNRYLEKLTARNKQGAESASALRGVIFGESFDKDQALTALKIINGVEKVMGKAALTNPVGIRFFQKMGDAAARTTTEDTALNSVLEFSLAPEAVAVAGQNYAHETMHVLQDLFKRVDPQAHSVLNKAFPEGMNASDIPSNLVRFLKRHSNPSTGNTYWSDMEGVLNTGNKPASEHMAYVFGAINDIQESGVKMDPSVGGAFVKFANFIKDVLRSIRNSVYTPVGVKSLEIMKKLASGERQKKFADAPLTRMSGSERQQSELEIAQEENFKGANAGRLAEILGETMYGGAAVQIAGKELIQNSFDGIKTAQASGSLTGPGSIAVYTDEASRTVSIHDNGSGMSRDTVINSFLTIGGSDKTGLAPQERSGGFGLAKISFLMASERIDLKTTKNGLTTSFSATGEDIRNMYNTNKTFKITTKETPQTPNGTSITVKFPEYTTNKKTGEKEKLQVKPPNILYSKFIGNVNFYSKHNSIQYPDTRSKPISYENISDLKDWEKDTYPTDISNYNSPEKYTFPWGEVDLFLGKEQTSYGHVDFLSSGVHQFSEFLKDLDTKPINLNAMINVKSFTSPSGDRGDNIGERTVYPFTYNREATHHSLEKDFEKIFNRIRKASYDLKLVKEVKNMSFFYEIPNLKEVGNGTLDFKKINTTISPENIAAQNLSFDTSSFNPDGIYLINHLNKDIVAGAVAESGITKARAIQFLSAFGGEVLSFSKTLGKLSSINPNYEAFAKKGERFVGLTFEKDLGGVNIRVPISGFFINPFYTKISGNTKTNAGLATYFYRVMAHEAAHETVRSHENEFAIEEISLEVSLDEMVGINKTGSLIVAHKLKLKYILDEYRREYDAIQRYYDRSDIKNVGSYSKANSLRQEGLEGRNERETGISPTGAKLEQRRSEEQGRYLDPQGLGTQGNEFTQSGSLSGESGKRESTAERPVVSSEKQSRQSSNLVAPPSNLTPEQTTTFNEINGIIARTEAATAPVGDRAARAVAKDISKGWFEPVKKFFDPLRGIGDAGSYRLYKGLTHGTIDTMKSGLKKLVAPISKATKDHPAIYTYMTTPGASPSAITDPEARSAAVKAKRIINGIQENLVRRKIISKDEADKYADAYLPRMFLAYLKDKRNATGMRVGFMDYTKSRVPLSEKQLMQLGEVKDPAYLISEAIFRPVRDMAILNFYERMGQQTGVKWVVGLEKHKFEGTELSLPAMLDRAESLLEGVENGIVGPDRAQETKDYANRMRNFASDKLQQLTDTFDAKLYKKIPNDKRYGSLRSMWIRKEIYEDVLGQSGFMPSDAEGMLKFIEDGSFLGNVQRRWKQAKVPLNPPTVVTNIMSNIMLASLSGHNLALLPYDIYDAMMQNIKGGKLREIAQRHGFHASNMSEAEMKTTLNELQHRYNASGGGIGQTMSMVRAIGRGMDSAADFYGTIETVFKMAIVKDGLRKGLSEKEAVLRAQKWLFDYSEVNRTVKWLRNIPFGSPFITWTYKVIPLMVETALSKNIVRFAPFVGAYYLMSLWATEGLKEMGGDDEDKRKLLKRLPERVAENKLLAMTGAGNFVNIGKLMPFEPFFKVATALEKGSTYEVAKSITLMGGPIADILIAFATGKDQFTGRDIVPKSASKLESPLYAASFLANEMLPAFLKDMPKMAVGSMTGRPDDVARSEGLAAETIKKLSGIEGPKRSGFEKKEWSEIIAAMLGINVYNPTQMQYALNVDKELRKITNINADRNEALKDPRLSPDERRKVAERYAEKIREAAKEIRKFTEDAALSPGVAKNLASRQPVR